MLLAQGYPPSTINMAVPYYQQTGGSSEWSVICGECPDIPVGVNTCGTNHYNIVGKLMNEKIGRLIKQTKIGGAFPWVLDYDVSLGDNKTCGDNSLFKFLKSGLVN